MESQEKANHQVVDVASAVLYACAYMAAAVVAHLNEAHQEFFPVYTAITVAAVLHLHATVNRNRRTPPPDGGAPCKSKLLAHCRMALRPIRASNGDHRW